MNTILDKHLPLKKLSKQEILQRDKPWITKGLTKSIKIKNVTHEKMRELRIQLGKKNCKIHIKHIKTKLQNSHDSAKPIITIVFLLNIKQIFWQGIKSVINTKPSKAKQSITTLKINDKIISNKKEIAETIRFL